MELFDWTDHTPASMECVVTTKDKNNFPALIRRITQLGFDYYTKVEVYPECVLTLKADFNKYHAGDMLVCVSSAAGFEHAANLLLGYGQNEQIGNDPLLSDLEIVQADYEELIFCEDGQPRKADVDSIHTFLDFRADEA